MQTPELRRRVEALEWYHTLELAPGVVTPGWFDTRSITGVVCLGSLVLHLRDPIGAIERVRSVCSGEVVVCDAIDPWLSRVWRGRPMASLDAVGRPWWWKPNEAALVGMVEAAGFEVVEG